MKKALVRAKASRFAVVVGASLTIMATSTVPAFALTNPGHSVPNAAPTARSADPVRLPCADLPCDLSGEGGNGPGTPYSPGGNDGGYRGSGHIGEGRPGPKEPEEKPKPPPAGPPAPTIGGGASVPRPGGGPYKPSTPPIIREESPQ